MDQYTRLCHSLARSRRRGHRIDWRACVRRSDPRSARARALTLTYRSPALALQAGHRLALFVGWSPLHEVALRHEEVAR